MPLLLFGTLSLLFRFPLRRRQAPPAAVPPAYLWMWRALFTAGLLVSLSPALDAYQRLILGSCMLASYARTWFRWGGEIPAYLWTLRLAGILPVLYPLLP